MTISTSTKYRVAVTQHEPEWFDLQKSVEKTCRIITEAADNGAHRTRPVDPILSTTYIKNSLVVDSDEMRTIQDCAAKHGIVVSLGFSENDNNSLYIAQAIIDGDGTIVMKRRKLKATHMERTIFGDSSGDSLMNVASTRVGKVGTLACWEHCQPLLKYHTLHQREQIHCSAWPPIVNHTGGPELWSMSLEGKEIQFSQLQGVTNTYFPGCQALSQVYAIESQTFVLHTTTVITEKGVNANSSEGGVLMSAPGGGASVIIGPDGRVVSTPLDSTTEGIVYGDIDLDQALFARSFLDICGHYSRPDLLWLGCDTRERKLRVEEKLEVTEKC
ncbi:putative cyanide hydratase protein [Botrytis fragariae]|uniref:nitrilase n=1 Tax=Botrytis fragariae TaxID=1964551 RepID=A0A8H6AYG4_9HELO|nr:putative cyanide hydratase protein [Botrytis fragariae]KAF5876116.1 putative cyanide hydratase protein [Botrytis fragariae]